MGARGSAGGIAGLSGLKRTAGMVAKGPDRRSTLGVGEQGWLQGEEMEGRKVSEHGHPLLPSTHNDFIA